MSTTGSAAGGKREQRGWPACAVALGQQPDVFRAAFAHRIVCGGRRDGG